MASFNRVILLGNLTRDPQLRYLPSSNTPVAEFGLATNRKFKTASGEEREEVCFVDCTAWGKQAEILNQYCQKGRPLFVEGRLKLDQWEDKQGGGKRSKLTVVVENFQLLGGRDSGGGAAGVNAAPGGEEGSQASPPRSASSPNRPAARPNAAPSSADAPAAQPPYGQEQQFKEDDIPF